MSQLKEIRQEELPLTQLKEDTPLILLKTSAATMRVTHIKKGSLLYSVYQVT